MEHDSLFIRVARPDDAGELRDIYAPYVECTAISFEYEVPGVEEFRRRLEHTLACYPFLVAEDQGAVLGYANAKTFIPRAAYDWSAEVTIYLRGDCRRRGIGGRLYRALEDITRAQNIRNLNACIGWKDREDPYITHNSVEFHAHMGYQLVGTFHHSGCKFGRWYDMVWMEKLIGDHSSPPDPLIPFPRLSRECVERMGVRWDRQDLIPGGSPGRQGEGGTA